MAWSYLKSSILLGAHWTSTTKLTTSGLAGPDLPALVAITQTSVIGSRMRRITPREAARLQGIPSEVFSEAGVNDQAAYKQLGNAVNVGVVRAAAGALFEAGNASWLAKQPVKLRQVV